MNALSKRVLVILGRHDHRLYRGVERYAREQKWTLLSKSLNESAIPWGWRGDGILASVESGDEFAEFVATAGTPVVDFSFHSPHLRLPRVLPDHQAAGSLAAAHFLERRFSDYLFYSHTDDPACEERGQGFLSALANSGCAGGWLRWNRTVASCSSRQEWLRRRHWLGVRLEQARKPVAVFAADDHHALEVFEACEFAGLEVPQDVALVGANDELLAPEARPTPISSIDTNLEQIGFQGANLLNDLLNGTGSFSASGPVPTIRVAPAGLVVRRSSRWPLQHALERANPEYVCAETAPSLAVSSC
jgi:LacI family transcriptional regulator